MDPNKVAKGVPTIEEYYREFDFNPAYKDLRAKLQAEFDKELMVASNDLTGDEHEDGMRMGRAGYIRKIKTEVLDLMVSIVKNNQNPNVL